jgi:hypothetical protein
MDSCDGRMYDEGKIVCLTYKASSSSHSSWSFLEEEASSSPCVSPEREAAK